VQRLILIFKILIFKILKELNGRQRQVERSEVAKLAAASYSNSQILASCLSGSMCIPEKDTKEVTAEKCTASQTGNVKISLS
jgi:hypothetical protein